MMYQISDIEEAVESRLTTKNGSRATTSADAILIGTLAVLQVARALQRIADVGEQYSNRRDEWERIYTNHIYDAELGGSG